MIRKIFLWLATRLVAVLLIIYFFAGFAADSIYKNVEDADGEMPATVAAFQSGPEVVSTVGGSGEGLNCSLPALTNVLFDGSKDYHDRRHLVLQRFRQACVFHDLCYRHGLATYGYNQNDCDRVLQNAALKLCQFIRGKKEEDSARCQTDSKLVLAGVSLGGYNAFRAWDRSTYFEFESDPSRSNEFLVSRVVDHPFKSSDPVRYQDDPDQVILTFENVRSNLTVTCVTCAKGQTGPDAKTLSSTKPVWLPPRRRHAAPHLLVDSTGKNHLIWMSRNSLQNTNSCVVLADAGKLLTGVPPKQDYCADAASTSLKMVESDTFSSSPLPTEVPGAHDPIYSTGITAQKTVDLSLSFCSRSALRAIDYEDPSNDDRAKCHTFRDKTVASGAALGAFQNFAVVRPGQHIYFARDFDQRTNWWLPDLWQHVWGDTYSPGGYMIAIDLSPPATTKGPLIADLRKPVRFTIEDRLDPMMPISRKRDDFRFLSLAVTESSVQVHMTNFDRDEPPVSRLKLIADGNNLDLHKSWALRPMLVLETKEAQPKTKLVFSRGELDLERDKPFDSSANTESLTLETLMFERDAAAPANAPFVRTGGATCTVTYAFRTDTDFPCYRAFNPKRPMRASPAARMQTSQLLVGRFAGHDGLALAFPDYCRKGNPVILKPTGDTFVPTIRSVGENSSLERTVHCDSLNIPADIAGSIEEARKRRSKKSG